MLMGESSKNLKESVKTSFSRVKEHILELESAIKENREFFIKQNEVILHLKSQIGLLMCEFNDLREEINSLKVSSGNGGVINNHQQSSSTIINNSQQSSTVINDQQQSTIKQSETPKNNQISENFEDLQVIEDNQQSSTIINNGQGLNIKKPIADMKKELEQTFNVLTDREFSVFMAVYQLEEQLPDVTYSDVSKMLKITEMTTRGYINSLMSKKLPLEKRRVYNRKVSLGINREFRELNLASFLLTLRLPKANFMPQKTLKNF